MLDIGKVESITVDWIMFKPTFLCFRGRFGEKVFGEFYELFILCYMDF